MGRKRFTVEQILHLLGEADVPLSHGKTVPVVCRDLRSGGQTHHPSLWTHGGLDVSETGRLKKLEQANVRLKQVLDEQAVDVAILREVDLTPWN